MSSMRSLGIVLPLILSTMAVASAPREAPSAAPVAAAALQQSAYAQSAEINNALGEWRRLRSSQSYAFAEYARFLTANPGWPAESALRRTAEKAMRPGENPNLVLAFFQSSEPVTGNGWARLAEANLALARPAEALTAARGAWMSSDLSQYDEQLLFSRFGRQFTADDHDQRIDSLLFAKQATDAHRMLPWASPARRASFHARIALQAKQSDAEQRYQALIHGVTADPGLMMDRARYLRESGSELAARQLFARPHQFSRKPADPERFLDMMVLLAKGAEKDRQWQLAYDIGRQADSIFANGADISLKSYGIRDNFTTLTWTAGMAALERLNRPREAIYAFDRYASGGRSLQVKTKGWYWAGRAAAQAADHARAMSYFERAAATPELFYGQLALERLGRVVPAPAGAPSLLLTDAQRRAFQQKRLVQATRLLGQQGLYQEQSLFIRALSESLDNDADRLLAVELSNQIWRPDLAVWTARSARNSGTAFYYKGAFPTHSGNVPTGRGWSLVHGITRQESSFDKAAVSHAGARGMMQLMPGTAREQAGKSGVGYDYARLTSDPRYNVMLGSAYFQRLVNMWDGNYPLAVASYNAGPGNVRRWVNNFGDPRGNVDIVSWIEKIPFEETRGYVQRVLENSVVYDRLNPTLPGPQPVHISAYLGKSSRPG